MNTKSFKGLFKGKFINENNNTQLPLDNIFKEIIKKKLKITQYYVPAFVRLDIRKISEINLSNSSAKLYAILKIDIKINKEIYQQLCDSKGNFKKKKKLTIGFHRSKPLVLPFYDVDDFSDCDDTDNQELYEWDDIWEGISL